MEWNELGPWGQLINFSKQQWDRISEQVENAYVTATV